MSRQEVYDAMRSRFDDNLPPTEKQMDRIWERLSERSLGYTDVSDAVWGEDEDDIYEKMRDGLADVINDEGLYNDDEDEDEPTKDEDEPTEDEVRIAKVEAFQKLMKEQKIPEQEWLRYWDEAEAAKE